MKLYVPLGPLPVSPPYLDWEEVDEFDPAATEQEEEIDLTDLFDGPEAGEQMAALLREFLEESAEGSNGSGKVDPFILLR